MGERCGRQFAVLQRRVRVGLTEQGTLEPRLDLGEGGRGRDIPGRGISRGPKAETFPAYLRKTKKSAGLEQSKDQRKIGRRGQG